MESKEKKLIIYGIGSMTKTLLADDDEQKTLQPAVFSVDNTYMTCDTYMGRPVIPFEEITKQCPPDEYVMLVVCGRQSLRGRTLMLDRAKKAGYELINYISPKATVEPGVVIGENNLIFSGARLGHDGHLGSNNVIRQDAYVGHDFRIGNGNFISVHCTLGSSCTIRDLSYFGLNVTCRDHLTFGDECLIGMGSVVTKPVDDYATAYGVPARIVSYHKDTGVVF